VRLCEVLWSPKAGQNYDAFFKRMATHEKRLEAMGVHYRP